MTSIGLTDFLADPGVNDDAFMTPPLTSQSLSPTMSSSGNHSSSRGPTTTAGSTQPLRQAMGIPDDSLKQRSTQRYPRKRVALDGQPKSNSFARLNTWFFLSPNSRPGVARRNYHVHPGNNVFMAGGRFLSARQRPLNAIVFAILLIEGGLYYGFV